MFLNNDNINWSWKEGMYYVQGYVSIWQEGVYSEAYSAVQWRAAPRDLNICQQTLPHLSPDHIFDSPSNIACFISFICNSISSNFPKLL